MLRVKLRHLDEEIQSRREVAEYYLAQIDNLNIQLPALGHRESHVWHLFVVRSTKRDLLQKYLAEQGVQTLIHYPVPPHQQHAYESWHADYYPVTERIHQTVLSLPIGPTLSPEDSEKVFNACLRWSDLA